ncbi:MAG: DUF427 domain-containing protein [Methyloligellaceae bacterium]
MKVPGPAHPIEITANPNRVVVTFDGCRIADTTDALSFNEAGYPTVAYIPREDVDMSRLARTAHTTHCPFKGDANYFSIESGDATAENAVWTYEDPYPAVAEVRDRLAFYTDKVELTEEPAT